MKPFIIVIEMVTPEVVKNLQKENEDLRDEIKRLKSQHNSLHETVYRFMDRFAELSRSLKDR